MYLSQYVGKSEANNITYHKFINEINVLKYVTNESHYTHMTTMTIKLTQLFIFIV